MTIDFTEWTDAQLEAARTIPSVHRDALNAEIERRQAEGVPDDGSKERVAALVASARRPRRRPAR